MDELKKLYDVVVRDGKYTKSFEEFQQQYQDPNYQKKVFDVVSRDGLYTKDFNSFTAKYAGKPQGAAGTDATVAPVMGLPSGSSFSASSPIINHIKNEEFDDILGSTTRDFDESGGLTGGVLIGSFNEDQVRERLAKHYGEDKFSFEEVQAGTDAIEIRNKKTGAKKVFNLNSTWNISNNFDTLDEIYGSDMGNMARVAKYREDGGFLGVTMPEIQKWMDESYGADVTKTEIQTQQIGQLFKSKLEDPEFMQNALGSDAENFRWILPTDYGGKGGRGDEDDYKELSKKLKDLVMERGWIWNEMNEQYGNLDETDIEYIIEDAVTEKFYEASAEYAQEQKDLLALNIEEQGTTIDDVYKGHENFKVESLSAKERKYYDAMKKYENMRDKEGAYSGGVSQEELDAQLAKVKEAKDGYQTWWNQTKDLIDLETGKPISALTESTAAFEVNYEDTKDLLEDQVGAAMDADEALTYDEALEKVFNENGAALWSQELEGKKKFKVVINSNDVIEWLRDMKGIESVGETKNGFIYEMSLAELAANYDYMVKSDGWGIRGWQDFRSGLKGSPVAGAVDAGMAINRGDLYGTDRTGEFDSPEGYFGLLEEDENTDFGFSENWMMKRAQQWWYDEEEFGDFDDRSQGFKRMLKDYRDDLRELQRRDVTLSRMHLLNEDVSTGNTARKYLGRGSEILYEGFGGIFGLDTYVDAEDISTRTQTDVLQGLVDEGRLEETEQMKEGFKRSGAMKTYEGVAGFVPAITEFALIEVAAKKIGLVTGIPNLIKNINKAYKTSKGVKLTGQALKAAKVEVAGGKVLRYGDEGFDAAWIAKTGGTIAKSNLAKGLHFAYMSTYEEAKMAQAFGEDYHMGGGTAFYGTGMLLNKLIPLTSRYARLNEIIKIGRSGVAGAVSTQSAKALEALVDDLRGNKTFGKFVDENYSELGELGQDALIDFFVFSLVGAKGHVGKGIEGGAYKLSGGRIGRRNPLWMNYQKLHKLERQIPAILRRKKSQMEADPDNKKLEQEYDTYLELYQGVSGKLREMDNWADWNDPERAKAMLERSGRNMAEVFNEMGIKVNYEATGERNNENGSSKFKFEDSSAEFQKQPDGSYKVLVDTTRMKPGKMPHEVFHLGMEKLFNANPEVLNNFKSTIEGAFKGVKFFKVPVKDNKGELTGEKKDMTLEELVMNEHGRQANFDNIKANEFLAYTTEVLSNTKHYNKFIKNDTFNRIKQDVNLFTQRQFGKTAFEGPTFKQEVIDFMGNFSRSVKAGTLTRKQVQVFKTLAEKGNWMEGTEADLRTQESRDTAEMETLSSKDLKEVDQTEKDNKRIDTELENYHRNNLEGKENITLDDLKELQGQKRRGPGYDIDMESPYTDFEKYPVLGNVLGRAFDQAVNMYQRNIPERYRINLNDRGYESERTELANEVLSNKKRGLLDIVRRYDPNNEQGATLKSWITGQLRTRMQELKGVSVDKKYESRAAEAEGVVVSGTDISEINMDLIDPTKGGGIDKSADRTGVNEKTKGIKLKDHKFEFEGNVKRAINPESVKRTSEAGEKVFNETSLNDLTFMGVATRMRESAMNEMDLLFRNGKELSKPKEIQEVEKRFTDNVNNAAVLYDAMPEFSHPKHYENTNWGKTVFKVFYEKTGEKFKSTDLPVELTKKTNARTEKYRKLSATPERIQEFIELMNTGRDAGVKNKKRATLKQGVGDIFTTQTFRDMLNNPEFIERAESTPEGKAKLEGLKAELAARKLRGATPEAMASKDVELIEDFIQDVKSIDWERSKDPALDMMLLFEGNPEMARVIKENGSSTKGFIADMGHKVTRFTEKAFNKFAAGARRLGLTTVASYTPKIFSRGFKGAKGKDGVMPAVLDFFKENMEPEVFEKFEKKLKIDVDMAKRTADPKFSRKYVEEFLPDFLGTFDAQMLKLLEKDLRYTTGEGDQRFGFRELVDYVKKGVDKEGNTYTYVDGKRHEIYTAEMGKKVFSEIEGVVNELEYGKGKKGEWVKDVKVNDNKAVKKAVDKIIEENPGSSPKELAKKFKEYLSPDGTVKGYERMKVANEKMLEYTADKIFDYIKSKDTLDAKAEAINNVFHMLQIQTNLGKGIFRGLATHNVIGIKGGATHSEHNLQLGNFTGNILLEALKNQGNKKKFTENVKALTKAYKQSIIDKALQKEFDAKDKGGRNGFDFAYNTSTGLFMWMRRKAVAEQNVDLSSGKTYDQLMSDVVSGGKAVEKLQTIKRKILEKNGLASKDLELTDSDVDMAIRIRDAALRNGRIRNKEKKGMSTFDFDETLIIKGKNFVTATKGKESIRISSEEFPLKGPELADAGYKFDFKDFVNVKGGVEGPLFKKLQNQITKYGNENVFVLTARMQESAPAIHQWLKSKGVELPIENITGLGNSSGEAKALWMLEKFARGYNDMYFVDDALPNVKAVKKVLDQLDAKSNVQQALASMNVDLIVNDMLEHAMGIESRKRFSKAEGKLRGKKEQSGIKGLFGGRRRLFLPDTAADLDLLLEPLFGKGAKGVKNKEWYRDNLQKPFERGINEYNSAKQRTADAYMDLRKNNKDVVKDLSKEVEGTSFTHDMAMRVWIWDKSGFNVPDLAETTKNKLVEYIENNPKYKAYAERVAQMTGIETGLKEPTENWWSETIAAEISSPERGISRSEHLRDFIEIKNEIFSEENLNKMESKLGSKWRDSMEDMLDRMETGRTRSEKLSGITGDLVNYLNGSVGAIMNFNTRSAVLQLTSTINFVNATFNNPARAAQAFANQKQYWADFMMIMNSSMLKQRRQGLQINVTEAEIAAAAAGSKNKARAVFNKMIKAGYMPTKIVDSFAIAAGGATFYRNSIRKHMKAGMTKAQAEQQAFLDFQAIAERTQQSSRPDLISKEQTTLGGRLILPFANTPMQMNRLAMKEILDIAKGRYEGKANLAEKLGKIGYYGFVQTAIFAGLSASAFALMANSDDEEQIEKSKARMGDTMMDSTLRGMGIKGAVLNGLRNAFGTFFEQREKGYGADYSEVAEDLLNISPPIGSKFRQLDAAGNTYKYNKEQIDEEGVQLSLDSPGLEATTRVVEATTNIPTHRFFKKANNISNALDSDFEVWQRILMGLGWSEWDVAPDIAKEKAGKGKSSSKKNKKKNKKKTPAFGL